MNTCETCKHWCVMRPEQPNNSNPCLLWTKEVKASGVVNGVQGYFGVEVWTGSGASCERWETKYGKAPQ